MTQADPQVRIREIIAAGHSRRSVARDPVNRPMINHLCDALGDTNPVHLDPDAARAAGFSDVVAPPAALQVWNMINPGEPVQEPSAVDEAYRILADAGFPNVVAVNGEQRYTRYLVPGDLLTCDERVEEISERKTTALGDGYFITTLLTFTDQTGEVVGTMRFRTLWYATAAKEDAP